MHSYQDALSIILNEAAALPAVDCPVQDTVGKVLAAPVISAVHIPPFDNSAMDGFALQAAAVERASAETPVRLTIKDVIAAGDAPLDGALDDRSCYQIMTGAPVPAAADTVIPIELVSVDTQTVTFTAPYDKGKNIRETGTDFASGDLLFHTGAKVTPQMIPALCSVGHKTVKVFKRPSVVWLSTGEELTDSPGESLKPGKIFNSSGPFGAAMLDALGGDQRWQRTIPDDHDLFIRSLEQAADENIDVIISTGAVSVGLYDFVRSTLEQQGWQILVHRVKVKPGKPLLFAKLVRSGGRDRYFFGLPGNPVSSAMGLRIFVTPFLRAMQGLEPEQPMTAITDTPVIAREGLTVFMKAVLTSDDQGIMRATSLEAQYSYQVGAMGAMNGWLIHPEGSTELAAGSPIQYIPFIPSP